MGAAAGKQILEQVYELCDLAEKLVDTSDINMSLRDILKLELQRYFMYLSASDGKVVPAERDYMNTLFDMNLSVQDYVRLIDETDTYSVDFENDVPLSMKMFAVADAKADKFAAVTGRHLPNFIPVILDLYKNLGIDFISCDGDIDDQERDDLVAYIAKKKIILMQIVETDDYEDIGRVGKKKR